MCIRKEIRILYACAIFPNNFNGKRYLFYFLITFTTIISFPQYMNWNNDPFIKIYLQVYSFWKIWQNFLIQLVSNLPPQKWASPFQSIYLYFWHSKGKCAYLNICYLFYLWIKSWFLNYIQESKVIILINRHHLAIYKVI